MSDPLFAAATAHGAKVTTPVNGRGYIEIGPWLCFTVMPPFLAYMQPTAVVADIDKAIAILQDARAAATAAPTVDDDRNPTSAPRRTRRYRRFP